MSLRRIVLVSLALGLCATAAQAQKPKHVRRQRAEETQEQLRKEAKITEDQARDVALKRYPKATVSASELEREHGRLIYSMELKVPGRSGVQEVNVNAITGKLVNVEHESAKTEKAEERREKRNAKGSSR